jgi:hypothetical protein
MHNGILKIALALTFGLALHISSLQAQILGPYGTSPTVFQIDSNGLLSSTGTYGTGSLSLSGAGTRMFWYPGKAAFRAGYVDGTQWNDTNIGPYSVALGYNPVSSGYYTIAIGNTTTSNALGSTAIGFYATATGQYALAMGISTSAGYMAAALNASTAAGTLSTSMGTSGAIGDNSTAMGQYTYAFGNSATSMGEHTDAQGTDSTAMGHMSNAFGTCTLASGWGCLAVALDSSAIGAYNIGGLTSNQTSWVATDPLFEIGNGGDGLGHGNPAATGPSDAFIVYKNGNVAAQGVITAAPGGDIPMFTGY